MTDCIAEASDARVVTAPHVAWNSHSLRPPTETRSCRCAAALLFVDIVGYTAFAEQHDPNHVAQALDDYFRAITAPVLSHRGTVVNYHGDGLFAAFKALNAATIGDVTNNALHAVQDLFLALEPFNDSLQARLGHRFEVRAGLNVGEVIVAHVGAGAARREVVLGDAVNVAARVEAANRELGTHFLATDSVLSALAHIDVAPVCIAHTFDIKMRGRQSMSKLYEIATRPARDESAPAISSLATSLSEFQR